MIKYFKLLSILAVLIAVATDTYAARIKDVANIRGVRSNQLVGYGLIVGLDGTGDGATQYTQNSTKRMLAKLGVDLTGLNQMESKNIAAVILTADLPAFAKSGNKIDIVVNAIGGAKSLKGGTLVQAPLRGADQKVYAVAQGSVVIGSNGKSVIETVGRVPNGGLIERDVGEDFTKRKLYRLTLNNPDFTTSARIVKSINLELGGKYASALDASTIDIVAPPNYENKGVELLATVERVQVYPDIKAKVIINEKTGTVVMGDGVEISPIVISHGDLSIKVEPERPKGRALASADGKKLKMDEHRVFHIDKGSKVGDVVKAMNKLGVTPGDLITILQNIKAAGALQGDLVIL